MSITIEPRKPPSTCDNCGNTDVRLTTNRDVYGPNAIDPHAVIYRCGHCRASVGCHPGTTIPMGFMACSVTRALRVRAHSAFDPIWRGGTVTRAKAYRMLAYHLRIDEHACHIATLTPDQLRATIQFSRDYFSEQRVIERRRDEKRTTKQKEREEREHKERKWRYARERGNRR